MSRKGIPNKRSSEVRELLDEIGLNPVVALAELALDPSNPPELRARVLCELMKYSYPALKAIEHSGDAVPAIVVNLLAEDAQL